MKLMIVKSIFLEVQKIILILLFNYKYLQKMALILNSYFTALYLSWIWRDGVDSRLLHYVYPSIICHSDLYNLIFFFWFI